jgi:hypothetical protein
MQSLRSAAIGVMRLLRAVGAGVLDVSRGAVTHLHCPLGEVEGRAEGAPPPARRGARRRRAAWTASGAACCVPSAAGDAVHMLDFSPGGASPCWVAGEPAATVT